MHEVPISHRIVAVQIPTIEIINRLEQMWINTYESAQNIYDALHARGPRIDVPAFYTQSRLMQTVRILEVDGDRFVDEIQRIVACLCLSIMGENTNEAYYILPEAIVLQLQN
jgi:hypothetical protein